MATVENKLGDFVIEMRANTMLSEFSSDFSEAILHLAARLATEKTSENLPFITTHDVTNASNVLCKALEKGIAAGELDSDMQAALEEVHGLCKHFMQSCETQHGKKKAPSLRRGQ